MDETSSKITPRNVSPVYMLAILITLTAGVSFLPAKWFGLGPAKKEYLKIDLSALDSVDDIADDSNGDGVVDWSEMVRQTYDGTDDDIIAAEQSEVDPIVAKQLNDPNNLTGSLSKNIYLASAYMKETGTEGAGGGQEVMKRLMAQEASKIKIQSYTLDDISIAKTENAASVKAYGNAMGVLLKKAMDIGLTVGDMELFKRFIDEKNMKAFDLLEDRRDVARFIASEMLVMQVPQSASAYHLVTLTNISTYADILENMLKIEDDPVRSALTVQSYTEAASDLLRNIPLLVEYFESKTVVFKKGEPGYVFDSRYTIEANN